MWSKKRALEELQSICKKWEHPPFPSPGFLVELQFLGFFALMIERIPDSNNIVPQIEETIERALKNAFLEICKALDGHKEADGSEIFNLASGNEFIRRSVIKAYNKKLEGKSPKILKHTEWIAYNNWLLTSLFWKAYKESFNSDTQFNIPVDDYPETPKEVLLLDDYKPLWAMRLAYKNAGVYIGFTGDSITVRPHVEWRRFMNKHKDPLPK